MSVYEREVDAAVPSQADRQMILVCGEICALKDLRNAARVRSEKALLLSDAIRGRRAKASQKGDRCPSSCELLRRTQASMIDCASWYVGSCSQIGHLRRPSLRAGRFPRTCALKEHIRVEASVKGLRRRKDAKIVSTVSLKRKMRDDVHFAVVML